MYFLVVRLIREAVFAANRYAREWYGRVRGLSNKRLLTLAVSWAIFAVTVCALIHLGIVTRAYVGFILFKVLFESPTIRLLKLVLLP